MLLLISPPASAASSSPPPFIRHTESDKEYNPKDFVDFLSRPYGEYYALQLARYHTSDYLAELDKHNLDIAPDRRDLLRGDLLLRLGKKKDALAAYRKVEAVYHTGHGGSHTSDYPVDPGFFAPNKMYEGQKNYPYIPYMSGDGSFLDNWLIRRFQYLGAWDDAGREYSRIWSAYLQSERSDHHSNSLGTPLCLQFTIHYAAFLKHIGNTKLAWRVLTQPLAELDLGEVVPVSKSAMTTNAYLRIVLAEAISSQTLGSLQSFLRKNVQSGNNAARISLAYIEAHQGNQQLARKYEIEYAEHKYQDALDLCIAKSIIAEEYGDLNEAVTQYIEALQFPWHAINISENRLVPEIDSADAFRFHGTQTDVLWRLVQIQLQSDKPAPALDTLLTYLDSHPEAQTDINLLVNVIGIFEGEDQQDRFRAYLSKSITSHDLARMAAAHWTLGDIPACIADVAAMPIEPDDSLVEQWKVRFKAEQSKLLPDLLLAIQASHPKDIRVQIQLITALARFDNPASIPAMEAALAPGSNVIPHPTKSNNYVPEVYSPVRLAPSYNDRFSAAYTLLRLYEMTGNETALRSLGFRVMELQSPFTCPSADGRIGEVKDTGGYVNYAYENYGECFHILSHHVKAEGDLQRLRDDISRFGNAKLVDEVQDLKRKMTASPMLEATNGITKTVGLPPGILFFPSATSLNYAGPDGWYGTDWGVARINTDSSGSIDCYQWALQRPIRFITREGGFIFASGEVSDIYIYPEPDTHVWGYIFNSSASTEQSGYDANVLSQVIYNHSRHSLGLPLERYIPFRAPSLKHLPKDWLPSSVTRIRFDDERQVIYACTCLGLSEISMKTGHVLRTFTAASGLSIDYVSDVARIGNQICVISNFMSGICLIDIRTGAIKTLGAADGLPRSNSRHLKVDNGVFIIDFAVESADDQAEERKHPEWKRGTTNSGTPGLFPPPVSIDPVTRKITILPYEDIRFDYPHEGTCALVGRDQTIGEYHNGVDYIGGQNGLVISADSEDRTGMYGGVTAQFALTPLPSFTDHLPLTNTETQAAIAQIAIPPGAPTQATEDIAIANNAKLPQTWTEALSSESEYIRAEAIKQVQPENLGDKANAKSNGEQFTVILRHALQDKSPRVVQTALVRIGRLPDVMPYSTSLKPLQNSPDESIRLIVNTLLMRCDERVDLTTIKQVLVYQQLPLLLMFGADGLERGHADLAKVVARYLVRHPSPDAIKLLCYADNMIDGQEADPGVFDELVADVKSQPELIDAMLSTRSEVHGNDIVTRVCKLVGPAIIPNLIHEFAGSNRAKRSGAAICLAAVMGRNASGILEEMLNTPGDFTHAAALRGLVGIRDQHMLPMLERLYDDEERSEMLNDRPGFAWADAHDIAIGNLSDVQRLWVDLDDSDALKERYSTSGGDYGITIDLPRFIQSIQPLSPRLIVDYVTEFDKSASQDFYRHIATSRIKYSRLEAARNLRVLTVADKAKNTSALMMLSRDIDPEVRNAAKATLAGNKSNWRYSRYGTGFP